MSKEVPVHFFATGYETNPELLAAILGWPVDNVEQRSQVAYAPGMALVEVALDPAPRPHTQLGTNGAHWADIERQWRAVPVMEHEYDPEILHEAKAARDVFALTTLVRKAGEKATGLLVEVSPMEAGLLSNWRMTHKTNGITHVTKRVKLPVIAKDADSRAESTNAWTVVIADWLPRRNISAEPIVDRSFIATDFMLKKALEQRRFFQNTNQRSDLNVRLPILR